MTETDMFDGTKLFLFLGDDILTIRRDNRPDIPWPGRLDVPGGAREGDEQPAQCVLRETLEEVGLNLTAADLVWSRFYDQPIRAWFFAAHLPVASVRDVVFGNEGAGWMLMPPEGYMAHPDAIPHFCQRLQHYLRP